MLTNKLLPGELVFKPSQKGVSSSRENVTPISRSGNSLARNLRNALLVSTALFGGMAIAPSQTHAFLIQGGATETVIGTGGGTQISPFSPGNLAMGLVGDGTLNISAGGLVNTTNQSFIGQNFGATGTINISGANSLWTSGSHIRLGRNGEAVMNITAGGKATALNSVVYVGNLLNSKGTLNINGANSELTSGELYVGDNGEGNVTISNGGKITSTSFGLIGLGGSGIGTVLVNGAGSQWTVGNRLQIAEFGTGNLTITQGGSVIVSNAIRIGTASTGVGKIVVSGTGSTLSAQNSFDLAQSGNGTLTLSGGGIASITSGTGTLVIAVNASSTGTLNIGSAAGDAAVSAGRLDAGAVIFGTGTGKILFNHTDTNHEFTAGVSGAGTIENLAGTTKLSGDLSAFTGTINANGGELYINTNASNAMAVNVNNGGMLGGSGTLSILSVNNGGTLAPGNSIGTLSIVGNASLASGSTYQVEIDNASNSDLLSVGGTLTIGSGASVAFSSENGTDTGATYSNGQVYTIATATGGVSGTFGSISDSFAFLDGVLSYNANTVFLTLSKGATFASVAQTSNQTAAAAAAETLGAGNAVYDALLGLNASTARSAFDQLSGEIYASARSVFIEDARYLRNAALSRLTRRTNPEKQLWGKFYGGYTSLKGNNNAASVKGRTGGFIAGYDANIDNWRFGGAAQIGRSSISVSDRQSSGKSTDYGASLYASTEFDGTIIAFGGAYSRHNISTSRSIAFGGLSETLSGDYHASTSQIFGKISHDFTIDAAILTPFAEVTHIMHKTDEINETGGAAALSSSSNTLRSTFVTLGVNAAHEFANTDGLPVKLYGTIGWRHAFDGNNQATNRFANGSSFAVQGAAVSKNAFVIDAGLDFALNETVDFGVGYSGQIGTNGDHVHSAKAVISAKF